MLLSDGTIIWNRSAGDSVLEMGLSLPDAFARANPGQFLMIKASAAGDPLLRRPFSIHRIDRQGAVSILYRTKGAGTKLLSALRPGDRISVLGPLGRGFSISGPDRFHILVAGGMGVAPLLFLAQRGVDCGSFLASNSLAIIGAKTAAGIYAADAFASLPMPVLTVTEDGSAGERGTALGALSSALGRTGGGAEVYACGPKGMISALPRTLSARSGTGCQVSVEERMACGLGACRSCAVPVKAPGGRRAASACTEGPVFNLDSLV